MTEYQFLIYNENLKNIKSHGISFNQAVEIFSDNLMENFDDLSNSIGKVRLRIVSETNSGEHLIVSLTEGINYNNGTEDEVIRIILVRKVTKRERKQYAECKATKF